MDAPLRKLASPEALLDIILEKIGQSGIVIVNPDGVISYANRRFQTLTGLGVAKLSGQNYFEVVRLCKEAGVVLPAHVDPVRKALKQTIFTQVTPFFCNYEKKSTLVPVALNVVQLRQGRKTIGALLQMREVKRTLNVGEMKSLFVSFAAHQLKTPSSIVKGFLELMIRQGSKAYRGDQWYNLQSAYESNENLIQLSKNLLNVTRLEGGLIEPKLSPFDPGEILQSKVNSHSLLVSLKKLKVALKVPERPVVLNSDTTFVSEIFEVLFGNALKYAPDSSRITVTMKKDKTGVRISVQDEGPGISEADQKQLFETTAHGSDTTMEHLPAEQTTSHGIGLLMAKKYITLLGGTIEVVSQPGQGSTFSFFVPHHPR